MTRRTAVGSTLDLEPAKAWPCVAIVQRGTDPPGEARVTSPHVVGIRPSGRSGRAVRRVVAAAATPARAAPGLVACSSGSGGPPVLNWYINPDNGGQKRLAESCAKAS